MLKIQSGIAMAVMCLSLGLAGCGGLSGDSGTDVPGPTDPGTGGGGTGPVLSVTDTMLDGALDCTNSTVATAAQSNPVLLIHSTGLTADQTWGGNYAKILPLAGYNTCTIDLPNKALGDIQISAQYVVAAIRRMNTQYAKKVNVLAHGQGGLETRWALKFWPDIAGKVDDFISLGAPNHGSSLLTDTLCLTPTTCTAAVNQQLADSNFLAALNLPSESVPAGVSYTSIYSLTDEIVLELPPNYTSALSGAKNILVQGSDVCPLRNLLATHLQLLTNGPIYALVIDAFTHPGAADPTRLDSNACLTVTAPGVTISDFLTLIGPNYIQAYTSTVTGDGAVEPPLASYALAP